MASTNVRSKPTHPRSSFVMLESFVEDALVYQPYVAQVRLDAGQNQSRKGLNRRATVARQLLCMPLSHMIFAEHAVVSVIFAEHVSYNALFTVCAFCVLMM